MLNKIFLPTQIYIDSLPVVKIEGVEQFSVKKTFDCGQCFRFDEVLDSAHECEYAGMAHGKYVSFAQDKDTLYIYNATVSEYEDVWESFLALDQNYSEIDRSILSLSKNPSLADALKLSCGIRILRQEKWEALCSFIISQNNNIPRIKKLVSALAFACDENRSCAPAAMEGHIADAHKALDGSFSPFPAPDKTLALGIDGLAALKVGFRAKYIYDASQKVLSGEIDLDGIAKLNSTLECSNILCKIKGVGVKVAACTLLFGFNRLDSFPIDVWIKRVIAKYFDEGFDPESLGEFAGVAQQYLFYYERYLNQE